MYGIYLNKKGSILLYKFKNFPGCFADQEQFLEKCCKYISGYTTFQKPVSDIFMVPFMYWYLHKPVIFAMSGVNVICWH